MSLYEKAKKARAKYNKDQIQKQNQNLSLTIEDENILERLCNYIKQKIVYFVIREYKCPIYLINEQKEIYSKNPLRFLEYINNCLNKDGLLLYESDESFNYESLLYSIIKNSKIYKEIALYIEHKAKMNWNNFITDKIIKLYSRYTDICYFKYYFKNFKINRIYFNYIVEYAKKENIELYDYNDGDSKFDKYSFKFKFLDEKKN